MILHSDIIDEDNPVINYNGNYYYYSTIYQPFYASTWLIMLSQGHDGWSFGR